MTKLTSNTQRIGPARASRSEYVLERIRESIQNGDYKPGERLTELELAERLGVSRTPVREALRRLESDGLLVFEPWRGVVVAELDHQQVGELYTMREVLEGTAARLAAKHISEAEMGVLETLLAKEAKQLKKPHELANTNRHFHHAIHASAHNRYLMQTLGTLRDSLALLHGTTFSVAGRARVAHGEHKDIVAAIVQRDGSAAEEAARAHIRGAERTRIKMLFELSR
jgi:DNA-binding GntR family transcriptional regulator